MSGNRVRVDARRDDVFALIFGIAFLFSLLQLLQGSDMAAKSMLFRFLHQLFPFAPRRNAAVIVEMFLFHSNPPLAPGQVSDIDDFLVVYYDSLVR
jgi:hypothetical protein